MERNHAHMQNLTILIFGPSESLWHIWKTSKNIPEILSRTEVHTQIYD